MDCSFHLCPVFQPVLPDGLQAADSPRQLPQSHKSILCSPSPCPQLHLPDGSACLIQTQAPATFLCEPPQCLRAGWCTARHHVCILGRKKRERKRAQTKIKRQLSLFCFCFCFLKENPTQCLPLLAHWRGLGQMATPWQPLGLGRRALSTQHL